jgi:hypothetical protein|tara:strand:- start:18249 stop:20441 length:2193 start_codon:yes stop_codon:yes gene_type:complete
MADTNTTSGSASKPFLKPNVLHQYASFNTIFTLSGITEQEIRTANFLTNPVHDIVARSGGIGDAKVQPRQYKDFRTTQDNALFRTLIKADEIIKYYEQYQDSIDILDRAHDLFIENVNMVSTVGPNAERNLGNFTRMEFEIHEPYSITFIEKVRAATAINGFLDYQDAPMLLTIEFKGFDEQGRPYTHHSTNKSHTRKIPILISRVDFDVNEGGAKYQVMAVPYTDLAFDDRFKYPRCSMPIEGNSPYEWAKAAEKALSDQMTKEFEEQRRYYPDVYKFEIDDELRKIGLQYKNTAGSTNSAGSVSQLSEVEQLAAEVETLAPPPRQNTMSAQASSGIAVTKFFEDAVRNGFHYQELANDFWTTYIRSNTDYTKESLTKEKMASVLKSKEFEKILFNNQYIDWFKIKTTVYTDTSKIDPITKMHPKTITYKAIPYKIHILKFVGPGVSIANVDWARKVHKEYNYIYTGDNVDVQSLRINYKTAYYLRNVRGDDKSDTEKGLFAPLTEAFKNVFGRERDPEPLLPLRQYPSSIKGANTVQTLSGESNKAQQFYDYLTNPEVDMMRIELEILGDPTYICQDMYVPIQEGGKAYGNKDESFDTASASFNADRFQPIISVRYRLPDDIDENEGTMFNGQGKKRFRDENLFFNGLYQVNKIDTKFDNGQFLQTLHCSRFNNQQGEGAVPLLTNASIKSITEIKESVNIEKTIIKPRTKWDEYKDSIDKINRDFPV